MSKDYYDILGIKRGTSAADIKKVYKKLARKYHPDVNPGDKGAETKFKEISEAYAVLGNKERRKKYDEMGQGFTDQGFSHRDFGFGGFDFSRASASDATFRDIFSELFRSSSPGFKSGYDSQPEKGTDIQTTLNVSFDDAIKGFNTTFTIMRDSECAACANTGYKEVKSSAPCAECGGSGQTIINRGVMAFTSTCRVCGGSGKSRGNKCSVCDGKGTIARRETVRVSIPAGVDTGSKIRVAGKGNAGRNVSGSGDLFIIIRVEKHPFFERKGNNIELQLPITFAEAALGAKIDIPTPTGWTKMRIPATTQNGQIFRLKGRGAPVLGKKVSGDLFVRANIIVPRLLDERSKEIVKELDELNPLDIRGFFNSI